MSECYFYVAVTVKIGRICDYHFNDSHTIILSIFLLVSNFSQKRVRQVGNFKKIISERDTEEKKTIS